MRGGTVSERPWGITLSSLAASRHSGQLTLTADDGKLYCIAFRDGAVVGASSPRASDSAVRVALTNQLVSSSQVAVLARAVAAAPDRDEVEAVAEAARLTREQVGHLRRRLLVQRVARTFSVDRGGYVLGEPITVATTPGIEVDVGPAIFLGVRMNLSQDRLAGDLRRLGARFVLRAEEIDGARLGFGEHERPILEALRRGTTLPELEARRRDLEPRLTQAVIYTLVAVGLCDGLGTPVAPPAEDEDDDELEATIARTPSYEGPRPEAPGIEPPRARTISSMPPLEPLRTGTPTERARAAADVSQRGMQALRREDLSAAIELLARAAELAPHDVDHTARLAWARFCAATDKAGLAAEVRRVLERAIFKSPTPVAARFYLGRVERVLGRTREAQQHFHEVLLLDPSHAEAAAELRLLAQRAARR